MDGDACVLIWILSVLGRDGVLLKVHGLARIEATVLKDHSCIPKDKIDGAVDVAFPEELPLRVDIEGVLVADDIAPVDHCVVSTNAQGHRLVLARTGPVLKCNVPSNESCSCRRCGIEGSSRSLTDL